MSSWTNIARLPECDGFGRYFTRWEQRRDLIGLQPHKIPMLLPPREISRESVTFGESCYNPAYNGLKIGGTWFV